MDTDPNHKTSDTQQAAGRSGALPVPALAAGLP